MRTKPNNLIRIVVAACLVATLGACGRSDGKNKSSATRNTATQAVANGCPSPPSNERINAIFERLRNEELARSGQFINPDHKKVDFLDRGVNCSSFTVHILQYGNDGKPGGPLVAFLTYATDGTWRLNLLGNTYKVE